MFIITLSVYYCPQCLLLTLAFIITLGVYITLSVYYYPQCLLLPSVFIIALSVYYYPQCLLLPSVFITLSVYYIDNSYHFANFRQKP